MNIQPIKIFKKFLIFLLAFFGISISLVATLFIWIYLNPHSAWKIAEHYFLPKDLKVTWQSLDFNIEKEKGQWGWQSQLKVHDLLITKKDPQFSAAIDLISIKILADLVSKVERLKIQDLQIISESPITFWEAEKSVNENNKAADKRNLYQIAQNLLQYLLTARKIDFIKKTEINLSQIKFFAVDPVAAPLKLQISIKKEDPISSPILFSVGINDLNSYLVKVKMNGEFKLQTYGTEKAFLSAKILGTGPAISFIIPLEVTFVQGNLEINSDAEFKVKFDKKNLVAFSKIRGFLTPSQADLQTLTSVSGLPEPIKKLKQIKANFSLALKPDKSWSSSPMKVDVSVPVEIPFINKKYSRMLNKSCACEFPKILRTKINGSVEFDNLLQPEAQKKTVAELELSIEKIENKLFYLGLGAKFSMLRDSTQFYYSPRLNSEFKTSHFQSILKLLAKSGILIPAPINVLDGFISMKANGPVDTRYENGKISATNTNVQVEVDLSSKHQKAKLFSTARIQIASNFKRIDIASKSFIENLMIELPPLDPIYGMPKIVRDSRIQMKPVLKKQPSMVKFYFDFEVETTKPGAIKLLSNLVGPYIPISVKIEKPNSQSIMGFVKFEPFKIEYLRRDLFVDSVKINLSETANNDFPIESELHVNQTAYKIFIHIGGTIGEPKIQLSSDPYLDREDIISVLLYDRPRSQLVGGDAETAGNVQAAIADKAIGLFGLWAFANTPIQSFSYNPITKVYTASFQLGNGVTAGVGTATDREASLALRKRISKRWILAASWVPNEEQGQTETIVLQWEKRF